MRLIFTFLLIICSFPTFSQNLVPNPGFENYIALPACYGFGTQAELSAIQQDWEILSGTPDIYSTLIPSSCFASCSSTDPDAFGQQQPHSGDFMGGILTYGAGMGSSSQYRESFEIRLNSPLVVGQQYYAEMYVSLGDSCSFASNNISLYFSVPHIDFDITNWGPLHFTPQVSETAIVADRSNWVKISGTFIADSPAEYLLIANFTDDSLTNAFHHMNNPIKEDAYYFIDDILVKETCLSVGSNQTICKGDSTLITASSVSFNGWALAGDPSVILSTDSVFTVSPSSTTSYLALSDCDTFSITVYVENAPPALFLGNDTTICEGKVLVLQATGLSGNYVWQDGSDKTYFDANKAGTYWLNETNQCGSASSQIELSISPLPVIPWDVNPWFCEGSSIQLTEFEPSLLAFQDDNAGNFVSSTVITTPGMYYLQVHNDCGYVSKNVIFETRQCDVILEMPNIVTPNGDQINDLLTPARLNNISEMKTTLLNRWGQVIFETSDPEIKWDGALYTDGVYFWKVEYVDIHSGRNQLQGFFQLIK